MYFKIIFVLATVCVVNASMLTVNDDDDAESQVKVSPSRCNLKACDWLCRSHNKTSGTCVNDHCKCEKSLIAEDADDMTDSAELLTPVGCNFRACQQQCRRLGYPRGACAKGVCKCDYLLNTKDAVTKPNVEEDSVQSRACNNNRCNQICRKQKFRGGACVGANCYCNKFLSLQDDKSPLNDVTSNENEKSIETLRMNEEVPIEVAPSACNTMSCNQWCHRLKYAGGWCRFGQCQCY